MKNKALSALLLLTAMPFFANGVTVKKHPKTKLLTHLKSVKAEIINSLPKNEINSDYIFAITLMNEFYKQSTLLQHYISSETNRDFNLIYNNMATLDQLFYIEMANQDECFGTLDQYAELYKIFESLYATLHKKYCDENPNGRLVDTTVDEMFEEAFELIVFFDGLIIPNVLIKKIDAKIAELEAQL
jgi:hypothetical protein